MEVNLGSYDLSKLKNGNSDEIMITIKYDWYQSGGHYTISLQNNNYISQDEFNVPDDFDWRFVSVRNRVLSFLNIIRNDIIPYFDVPIDVFEVAFQSKRKNENWNQTWHFKSLSCAKDEKKEMGWGSLSANNIDMRLPESALSKEQQCKVTNICNSKVIVLFEDFDNRYGMLYFELQPSSYSESMRFGFRQLSDQEEYETVRNSKECRNAAMRCILPILGIISSTCDNVEEDKVFDLIDGKIERLCFHGKVKEDLANKDAGVEADSSPENEISIPIQLSIPSNARKCSLSDGKDGNYNGYKAYIECSFDTGKLVKYIYYENSLTEDVDNYLQCPVPKDDRRKAKGDIINVLKNAGFSADFEAIEKFKAKGIKTLIMNR